MQPFKIGQSSIQAVSGASPIRPLVTVALPKYLKIASAAFGFSLFPSQILARPVLVI
jgi:hypothetical protein